MVTGRAILCSRLRLRVPVLERRLQDGIVGARRFGGGARIVVVRVRRGCRLRRCRAVGLRLWEGMGWRIGWSVL